MSRSDIVMTQDLREVLILAGGVEDSFIDLFGYGHHLCSQRDGMTFEYVIGNFSHKKLLDIDLF